MKTDKKRYSKEAGLYEITCVRKEDKRNEGMIDHFNKN
jgi:hypothetical protein